MRKVTYGINLSLDGCCDHTKFGGGADILQYFGDLMRDVDLIVYGRKTYELMVPYWPDVAKSMSGTEPENEFARIFTDIEKLLVSNTLKTAGENTRILRSNPEEEILKLKQQPGKKISLGGVTLPAQIIAQGLVDEFYFVYHPVIVGDGRKLFAESGINKALHLKLVNTKIFESGCVALEYEKGL